MQFLIPSILDVVAAFILDFTFGDPQNMYHPVRIIGSYISKFDGRFHNKMDSDKMQKVKGLTLWISTVVITLITVIALLKISHSIHPVLYRTVNVLLIWMAIASKSLKKESMYVFTALNNNDIYEARRKLSYIVGRDTKNLGSESIIQATVETISESTSDGVIAPLFYALIGGAPLMWVYKAVNTLDSMVGYTNERYKNLGFVSAKMDDLFNYLPARLTALLLIASSYILGYSFKNSFRTWRRDRRNHKSPNSGHPEAAAAGALGIQLGGDSIYSGQLVHKPFIGDKIKCAEFDDIKKMNRMMQTASILFMVISGIISIVYMKGGV